MITCQIYGKLKYGATSPNPTESEMKEKEKAAHIDDLRRAFHQNLRVAYVGVGDAGGGGGGALGKQQMFYSVPSRVEADGVTDKVLYKVKLPGNPILGEGKPENQNHAIIFTCGEHRRRST